MLPRLGTVLKTAATTVALAALTACGGLSDGERAEYSMLATRMGVPLEYIWVLDLDGLDHGDAGGPGVFGDSAFQDHYTTADGAYVSLTVDATAMDDASCPGIPVAGVSSSVQCAPKDGGWLRTTGLLSEYAQIRDGLLIRVTVDDALAREAEDAVKSARPADADELETILAGYRTDDEK